MIQVKIKPPFWGEAMEMRVTFEPGHCSDLVGNVTSQTGVAQLKSSGRGREGYGEKSGQQPPK